MRKAYNILLLIALIIVCLYKCEPTKVNDKINELKPLEDELSDLKALNDSLEVSYQTKKIIKDSLVIRTKTKYITIYDTLECLPKKNVDSLIVSYEDVINEADTLLKVKSLTIVNLTKQNDIKDDVIHNQKREIKIQKRKKWLFLGVGYLLGKVF